MSEKWFILFHVEKCYWLKTKDDVIVEGSRKMINYFGKQFNQLNTVIENNKLIVVELKSKATE